MPNLLKKIKPEVGSVAITALVVMIILGALGATLIKQSITGNKVSTSHSDGIAAQYLAEAGFQHAQIEIENKNNPTEDFTLNDLKLPDSTGNYNVTIKYDSKTNLYTITSIGTVNGASRQLVKTVPKKKDIYEFAVYGGESDSDQPLSNFFSVALDRGVSIYPSTKIIGDVGCNSNIDYGAYLMTSLFTGAIEIDGDVIAAGNIVTWPSFGVVHGKGKDIPNSNTQTIPTVVFPSNYNKSPNKPLTDVKKRRFLEFGHDYILKNNIYYTDEDLELYNNLKGGDTITGDGTILVNGDLILHDNPIPPHVHVFGNANITGNITLIVAGDIILEPLTRLGGEVLVMAGGDIWVGTGVGYPLIRLNPLDNYPATIDKGVLLANGNIFINNMGDFFGNTLKGCVIAGKTVTLYGNSKIEYDKNLINRIRMR